MAITILVAGSPIRESKCWSLIGFLAAVALVDIVGAVLVKRGRKQDHASQEELDTTMRVFFTALF